MREDLLHFIWKYKKFRIHGLQTTQGQSLHIIKLGIHNHGSGPDFLNAKLEIGGQFWAGNIEIHQKASNWYAHRHENDKAYQNVILHVIWEDDRAVFDRSGELLSTLLLKPLVQEGLLERYEGLLRRSQKKFINCEDHAVEFPLLLVLPWMEHLYRERLEEKTKQLREMLEQYNKDWERLLFVLLLRSFGQRRNSDSFLNLARAIEFNMVRKMNGDTFGLECLLFGMSGILEKGEAKDTYHQSLYKEYVYLKKKFGLPSVRVAYPEFMGVRPYNFPTIRLSQFAVLYANNNGLFSKIIEISDKQGFYDLFDLYATEYWNTHYTFGKTSVTRKKGLSKAFIDHIIINTVLPIKFLYAKEQGSENYPGLRSLISQLKKENNRLTDRFIRIRFPVQNALDSQAMIQLYDHYCTKNRCLECALGNQILN